MTHNENINQPPHDKNAEQSTLGAMMLDMKTIPTIMDNVKSKDFYHPAHELIFDAIETLYNHGDNIDAVLVCDELNKTKNLNRAGGATYLHTLISSVPTTANGAYYARIVSDKAKLRRLTTAGTRIHALGMALDGGDIDDLQQAAHAELTKALDGDETLDWTPIGACLESTIDAMEANAARPDGLRGIPTGLVDLDHLTGGLTPGQMIVIAARPAVGKSTLGLDIARQAAIKANAPTAFFSLEMSSEEITQRTFSAEAGLPLGDIRSGKLDLRQWTKLSDVAAKLENAPLYIDSSPNLTMTQIRSKCRQIKNQKGLALVVIDYLQLMSTGKRVESRQQEVSEISRNIKLLAKELNIPIIAISQLNRSSEQRTDKKPLISDLRESGSIEQDADIIILLHREDATNKEHPRAGEADLIVAKHRNGPTATITAVFQGHYSRFTNMAA